MRMSESIKNLAQALMRFHREVKAIERDGTNVLTKGGLTSKYATLDNIIENVRPILAAHGLMIIQEPGSENGEVTMKTTIIHESGEWMESDILRIKPVKSDPQGIGGAITYARRYQLGAVLNLATEDDDDGNYASGREEARAYSNRTMNKKPEPKSGGSEQDKLERAREATIRLGMKYGMKREDVLSMVMEAAKGEKPTFDDYRAVYKAIQNANENTQESAAS